MFSRIVEAPIARFRVTPRPASPTRPPRRAVAVRQLRRSAFHSSKRPLYEDVSKRRLWESRREDHPPKPLPIQLAESIEGICLLAALTLKLVPVCYAVYLRNREWRQKATIEDQSHVSTRGETETGTATVGQQPVEQMGTGSLSHLSSWSGWALLTAVVIGSLLRRFYVPPSDASMRTKWSESEREDFESTLARSFAEIAHMAAQIENLRTKVRSMRREYTSAFETADVQSDRWRRSVEDIAKRIDGTESRIHEFGDIIAKMQGFASKQFTVVSTALRRIDKECKSLTEQLREMTTSSTSNDTRTEPTETELDFLS